MQTMKTNSKTTAKRILDEWIENGDYAALQTATQEERGVRRVLRRISAMLYSVDPKKKWAAVSAFGALITHEALDADQVQQMMRRLLWSLNDESGAVPYGATEALGELANVRPSLRDTLLPILVSFIVDPEVVQTGPIMAGCLWALGHNAPLPSAELERLLPGLIEALSDESPEVRASAAWSAGRLGLSDCVQQLRGELDNDRTQVTLLIDGSLRTESVSELARAALAA